MFGKWFSDEIVARMSDRRWWVARHSGKCNGFNAKKLEYWNSQAKTMKPIQYILGTQPFLNTRIIVRQPILIPRQETEQYTEYLINQINLIPFPITVLDACCGSGCISLAIAKNTKSKVIGIDINKHAINLSKINQRLEKIPPEQLNYIQADIKTWIQPHPFNLVISNPPYIDESEYSTLPSSVRDYEDKNALIDPNPFSFYESVSRFDTIKVGELAEFWFEVGDKRAASVSEIIKRRGFKTNIWSDYYKVERAVYANRY